MNRSSAAIAACATALCAAMAVALSGHAQTQFPSKPVRLLIPFPPGGPTDSAVRVFLPVLSQALGQEFSIVNMAGSHGALAPTALLNEPPDGHTLLVGNSSPLVRCPCCARTHGTIRSGISRPSRSWAGRRSCWW